MLIKKQILSNFGLNVPIFSQMKISCGFSASEGPTKEVKTRFFVEMNLYHNLGEGKMYLAALQKTPNQTIDSSQVFEM